MYLHLRSEYILTNNLGYMASWVLSGWRRTGAGTGMHTEGQQSERACIEENGGSLLKAEPYRTSRLLDMQPSELRVAELEVIGRRDEKCYDCVRLLLFAPMRCGQLG